MAFVSLSINFCCCFVDYYCTTVESNRVTENYGCLIKKLLTKASVNFFFLYNHKPVEFFTFIYIYDNRVEKKAMFSNKPLFI